VASSGALTHIRNYASAGVLTALAGVVTFPLFTRALSVSDYGILGLITSSLTLFIAVGKLGMQHAVIRFFSQIKNGNIAYSPNQLSSTVVMLFFLFSIIAAGLWLIVGFAALPRVSEVENVASLLSLAAGIIFMRLLASGMLNYMQAQQRSAVVSVTQIVTKYLYLGTAVLIFVFGNFGIASVLLSMLVAEIIGFLFAGRKFWPDFYFSWSEVTSSLSKAMLMYGMPLMMVESMSLIMRLSDRYIIQAMLGENELGMYSASYNLVSYLELILLGAMVQALRPYYLQLWESEGLEKTRAFLSGGLHSYLVIGFPLITLFSLVSPYLLSFLASEKYLPGTIIIPFVALSYFLEGAMYFLAAGLYIKKNTKVLMFWGAVATVLNLGLNVLFVPVFGILAAAMVTVLCYVVFVVGISYRAFAFLSFDVKSRIPLLIVLMSLIVYMLVHRLDFGGDVANLLGKGSLGGVLLVGCIVTADAQIRGWLFERMRPRKAGTAK